MEWQTWNERVRAWKGIPAVAVAQRSGRSIQEISYAQLHDDIARMVGMLERRGLAGKHLLLADRNRYEAIVYFLAAVCAGCTVVWGNTAIPAEDLLEQAKFARVHTALLGEEAEEQLEQLCLYLPCVDISGEIDHSLPLAEIPDGKLDDIVCMMFTSGSTGTPKAVQLTQRNLIGVNEGQRRLFPEAMRCQIAIPIYHVFGCTLMLFALNLNGVAILSNMRSFVADVIDMHPYCMGVIGSMQRALLQYLKQPDKREAIRSSGLHVLLTAGMEPDPAHLAALHEAGFRIQNDYGMTEASLIGYHVDIRSPDDGLTIADDMEVMVREGEILTRGVLVTPGYYRNPQATKELLHGGWLHTGDTGYLDDQGLLHVTGRKKNLIILSNGENVSPEELELRLRRIPLIREVMVCERHDHLCARILPEAADVFDCEAEQRHIREAIERYNQETASFWRIHEIEFVTEDFARTSNGKLVRRKEE